MKNIRIKDIVKAQREDEAIHYLQTYYVKSFPTNPQPLTSLPNIDTIKATFGL